MIPVALSHESKIELKLNLNDSGEGNTTKLLHEEVSKVRWLARERRPRAGEQEQDAAVEQALDQQLRRKSSGPVWWRAPWEGGQGRQSPVRPGSCCVWLTQSRVP
jgi:hypothetical protein